MTPLTLQQIDTATGRELDALVAERVMGWTKLVTRVLPSTRFHLYGTPHQINGDPRPHVQKVPAYSTDGNAMLLVMKAMRAKGFGCMMEDEPEHKQNALFVDRQEGVAFRSVGASLPEAVCRAALKVVLAQQDAKSGTPCGHQTEIPCLGEMRTCVLPAGHTGDHSASQEANGQRWRWVNEDRTDPNLSLA